MCPARFDRGLVIGKFHPPHRGHGHLVETALRQCNAVTAIVCAAPGERPAASARAAALGRQFPGLRAAAVEPPATLADDDSVGWADYVRRLFEADPRLRGTGRPGVVFTSEAYGEAFAGNLGAIHVPVDPERRRVPVRGRVLRADILAGWDDILPEARRDYLFRIAVVGPESSGKTTLARGVAHRLGAVWVPEYARTFTDGLLGYPYPWEEADFTHIQQAQLALENALAAKARGILICDTSCDTTTAWMERYGVADKNGRAGRKAAEERSHYALHVVCRPDFGFVQDGTRDTEGDPVGRADMFASTRSMLETAGVDWMEVAGGEVQREDAVIRAIIERLPSAAEFASRGSPGVEQNTS